MEISQKTKDRLLALMRPAEDVQSSACTRGILQTIEDEVSDAQRIVALAFVFHEVQFAHFSGPKTPSSAYPAAYTDEEVDAMCVPRGICEQLAALEANLIVEKPDVIVIAERAWVFLERAQQKGASRALIFSMMLKSRAFAPRASAPPSMTVPSALNDPEGVFDATLFRHRASIRMLNAIEEDEETFRTPEAQAYAVLNVLDGIEDPAARAIVFARWMQVQCERDHAPMRMLQRALGIMDDVVHASRPAPRASDADA